MARELPIQNGRLTTDLNADGHLILNLRGGGFVQAQADWNESDSTAPDYIKNKPSTMPPTAHTHSQGDVTGLTDALAGKATSAQGAKADAALSRDEARKGLINEWTSIQANILSASWDSNEWTFTFIENGSPIEETVTVAGAEDALEIALTAGIDATRTRLPKWSEVNAKYEKPSGGIPSTDMTNAVQALLALANTALQSHQQLVPVYGGNGEKYSDWTVSPPEIAGDVDDNAIRFNAETGKWDLYDGQALQISVDGTEDDLTVVFPAGQTFPNLQMTITRTANPIIGYTLGTQTPQLQPMGNYLTQHQELRYPFGTEIVISSGDVETDSTDAENPIDYAAVTPADRTGNKVSVQTAIDELRLSMPSATPGYMRDFTLYLIIGTSASDAYEVRVDVDDGSNEMSVEIGAKSLADVAVGKNVILFSEIAAPTTSGNTTTSHWLVSVKHEDFASSGS